MPERQVGPSVQLQLFRYGIIGITLNGAGYLLYLLLTGLGMSAYWVVAILYPVSISLTFALNRFWTFRHQGEFLSTLLRFLLVQLGGFLLNLALLAVFFGAMGFPHQLVQAAAIFIVAGYLFLSMRNFVYVSNCSAGPDHS